MLDPAIQAYLDERKSARLKSKIKPNMSEEEVQVVKNNATKEFLLDNWLPKAANRAWQVSLVSHPSKFTHSSAKTSAVIASNVNNNDGFLRTGNSGEIAIDVSGNAAALDVYNFLSLRLKNGQTLFEQLEQDSETLVKQFTLPSMPYHEIKEGLLTMKPKESDEPITSERVKQIYFPVTDNYHLLSILTPSGIIFKFKKEIDNIRFSEDTKKSRLLKNKNEFDEKGFDEIYGLTAIGYGGANPQGVSLLNSQTRGIFYLLPSMPPSLQILKVRPPKTDFFSNTLYFKHYENSFKSLDKLMSLNRNTVHIRLGIDNIIRFIISQVIEKSWTIRQLDDNWSEKGELKRYQKIWLDNHYQKQREDEQEWCNDVITEMARWFISSYKKVLGDGKAKQLVDTEFIQIKALITEQKDGLL